VLLCTVGSVETRTGTLVRVAVPLSVSHLHSKGASMSVGCCICRLGSRRKDSFVGCSIRLKVVQGGWVYDGCPQLN
jgi:hypothetical protein